MNEEEWLAQRFEEHRARLRGVAYRMLGSLSEADDALQDAWLRVSRSGAGDVDNLAGWLTTVVARVSLNRLRARNRRHEAPFAASLPDPMVRQFTEDLGPEDEAILADSVGLALLLVLETLSPAERLAFVLHDTFEVPFEDIAAMLGRSSEAARQLASRARRRVRQAAVREPDAGLPQQRVVVDAFFRAARHGDFKALLAVLDPDAILRADYGSRRAPQIFRGAEAVAEQSRNIPGAEIRTALVNGAAGAVILVGGRPYAVMGFIIRGGVIVEIDAIADPERVQRIAAGLFDQ